MTASLTFSPDVTEVPLYPFDSLSGSWGFNKFLERYASYLPSLEGIQRETLRNYPGFVAGLLPSLRRLYAIRGEIPDHHHAALIQQEMYLNGSYINIPEISLIQQWFDAKDLFIFMFSELITKFAVPEVDNVDLMLSQFAKFVDLYWDGDLPSLWRYLYVMSFLPVKLRKSLNSFNFERDDFDGEVEKELVYGKSGSLGTHFRHAESIFVGVELGDIPVILWRLLQQTTCFDVFLVLRSLGYLGDVPLEQLGECVRFIPPDLAYADLQAMVNNKLYALKPIIQNLIREYRLSSDGEKDSIDFSMLVNMVRDPYIFFTNAGNEVNPSFRVIQAHGPHHQLLENVHLYPEFWEEFVSGLDQISLQKLQYNLLIPLLTNRSEIGTYMSLTEVANQLGIKYEAVRVRVNSLLRKFNSYLQNSSLIREIETEI